MRGIVKASVWLLSAAAALALGGCSGEAGSGPPLGSNEAESGAQQAPVTLSMYISGADISDEELQRYFHEPLRQKLPHITLEIVRSGKGTSIEELVTSGSFPDLIYTSNPNLGQYKPYDILSDLSGLVKTENFDIGRFEDYEWEAIRMQGDNGELFGVPFSQNVAALIYNKDLFDKFAVPYPPENMTWDDVYELAKKLTHTEGDTAYIGIDPSGPWFVGSGLSLNYVDPASNRSVIDSEAWKMVFSTLQRFYTIPGFLGPGNKVGYGTATFAKDRIMAMNPIWASSLQANLASLSEMNWDLTTLPNFQGSVGKGREVDMHLLGIAATSEHKEQAFEVIKAVTSDEVQTIMSRNGRITVLKNEEIKKQYGAEVPEYEGKNIEAFFKTTPSPYHQATPYDKIVRDLIEKERVKLATGTDVNTFIREMKERADQAIETELNAKK